MTKLSPIIEAPSQELSFGSELSNEQEQFDEFLSGISKKSASKKSPSKKSLSKKSPSKKSLSKKSLSKKSPSKKSPSKKSLSKKSPSKKSPSKKSLSKKSVSKKYIKVDEWIIPSYLTRSQDSNKIKYKKFKSLLKKNNVPINDERGYPARLYRNKQLIKFCKEKGVDPSDIDSKYNDWQSLLKNVKYTDIIKKLFESQDINKIKYKKFKSLLEKNNIPVNDENGYPALIKFCEEQGVNPSDIDSKYNDWQSLLKNVKYTDIIKKLFKAQDIDNTGGRKRKRKSKRKNKFGGSKGG